MHIRDIEKLAESFGGKLDVMQYPAFCVPTYTFPTPQAALAFAEAYPTRRIASPNPRTIEVCDAGYYYHGAYCNDRVNY